jgi:class 3 adenylate cyclase
VVDALPAQLDAARAAQAVGSMIGADAPSPEMLLMYERYLEAGRHQRLRPVVVAWNGHLKELVREVLRRAGLPDEEDRAGLVLAVADGVAVTALAEGAPPDVAIVAALEQLFSLLADGARRMQ